MTEGEVWIDRPAMAEKARVEREARAAEVRNRYPSNRQGKRAAARALMRLGLR